MPLPAFAETVTLQQERPADADIAVQAEEELAEVSTAADEEAVPLTDSSEVDGEDLREDKAQAADGFDINIEPVADEELQDAASDEEETVDDTEETAHDTANELSAAAEEDPTLPSVRYEAHVQKLGWQKAVQDGDTAGTTGKALRVEALRISISGKDIPSGSIQYRAHVQRLGWQDWVSDGTPCGTSGKSLRVEALQVRLTGELAEAYDVSYRVHVQGIGWMAWAKNGELAGTSGQSRRIEAIQIQLTLKGESLIESFPSVVSHAFSGASGLQVQAHVQSVGWQQSVGSGAVAGTTGRALRVEALRLSVAGSQWKGSVRYAAHVQGIGWQGWVQDGKVAGTTGQGRRVEAFKAQLTDELSQHYDLWYRVHVQSLGWMGWASNGQPVGTEGLSLRVEAVQFVLVEKGSSAPSSASTFGASYVSPTSVAYSVAIEESSWQGQVSDGATAGTTGKLLSIVDLAAELSGNEAAASGCIRYDASTVDVGWHGWAADGSAVSGAMTGPIEAVKFQLTGDVASLYSVWYRVHLSKVGWLGWAKDGQTAGTLGSGMHVEALQVRLVPKKASAPGANSGYFRKHPPLSGDSVIDNLVWGHIDKNSWSGLSGLRASYDYVRNYPYMNMSHWPGANWKSWVTKFAKEMVVIHGGNCHRFASLQYWFCQALGFTNAHVVTGQWQNVRGSGDHSWVELTLDGQIYIIDAELGCSAAYPEYNWCLIHYKDALIRYYDLNGNRILR